jgi:hypothetical protein
MAKELTQQKTDFIFGSALLFFSFALQFFSKAISGMENILLPISQIMRGCTLPYFGVSSAIPLLPSLARSK